ncbi:dihydrodipicolinate synthase family protein [Caldivirga sp. UBA161]|uniref:dihydrodipicolinate synthase family protein n=1 Tax=Caldivirga sp. UBA161 TaxID=1915569 RepID=UPI0025C133CE|nr:dihydrodipicolinate synthase family protein [Caldivirga sp. UBA161]
MEGVLVALTIPFRNGNVDVDGLSAHVSSLVKEGVNGFFPLGTTGMGVLLNLEEREAVIKAVTEASGGKPIVVQVGSLDWDTVAGTVKLAERYGASAIASIVPIYYRPDYETIRRYFMKLNQLTELPTFIYNIPGNAGFNVTPDIVTKLIKDGVRIAGMKDSSGDLGQLMQFIEMGLEVFNGSDHMIAPSIIVGAKGCISALSNSITNLVIDTYRKAKDGDVNNALRVQALVTKVRDTANKYPRPAVHYSLVRLLKYDFGSVKEPLVRSLTREEEESLASDLGKLGLRIRAPAA